MVQHLRQQLGLSIYLLLLSRPYGPVGPVHGINALPDRVGDGLGASRQTIVHWSEGHVNDPLPRSFNPQGMRLQKFPLGGYL